MTITDLVHQAYSTAKDNGFWDTSQTTAARLMHAVSELGEAYEADRKGDSNNFAEELADAVIIIADICGGLNVDLEKAITEKMVINEGRPKLHGKLY